MLPTLGSLFGVPVSAYFALLVLGYMVAFAIVALWAKRAGHDVQSIVDAALAAFVGGVLGGRLLHVLADGHLADYVHLCSAPAQVGYRISRAECLALPGDWEAAQRLCHPLARDCWAWAKFYNGGLALYGGILGGGAALLGIARRDGLPRRALSDAVVLAAVTGIACGRVGCFLAGCCYGETTALPWGVRFPAGSPASGGQYREGLLADPGFVSLPVHPTQLYEVLGCLLLASWLARWAPRRFAGERALCGVLGYAGLRAVIELVRADDRGQAHGLSTAQWFGLLSALACAFCWRSWSRRPSGGLA